MINKCIDCGNLCSGKRCKECFIKYSGKSFDFGKWHFDSKTQLDNAIKTNLKFMPYNIEVENDFLLSVINNLHKEVKKRNFRCIKLKILNFNNQIGEWSFAKKRFRGGILVLGYFTPMNQWHGVTVYPHQKSNVKQKLIQCLRQKWAEQAEVRKDSTRCNRCGEPNPQLHHKNIPFKDIANECLNYFTKEELEKGIGDDWWWHESEADAIPNNHPAIVHMLSLHEKVEYEWLCYGCHKKNGNTKTT